MRAYVLDRYGGPEGARLTDVAAPVPGPADILVNVRAAGLNPVDFKFRQGKLRVIHRPKLPFVLGNELAGEVAAVGSGVKRFRVGDRVFARVGRIVAARSQNKPASTRLTPRRCRPISISRLLRRCRWRD